MYEGILIALALVSVMAAPAWADSFQLNSFTISIEDPVPATLPLPVTLTPALSTPYNFSLNTGQSTGPLQFIGWQTPGDNKYGGTFTAYVSVLLNMTLPSNPSDPVDLGGVTRAEISGNNNDRLTINFLDPVSSYWGFGNSGRLDIDLSNVSATIHNGDSGDSGYITANFTYVSAPTDGPAAPAPAPVPEPGSLFLLGTGLVGLGRALRKQR